MIAEGGTDIRVAFSCLEMDEIPVLFDMMYDCSDELRKTRQNEGMPAAGVVTRAAGRRTKENP